MQSAIYGDDESDYDRGRREARAPLEAEVAALREALEDIIAVWDGAYSEPDDWAERQFEVGKRARAVLADLPAAAAEHDS